MKITLPMILYRFAKNFLWIFLIQMVCFNPILAEKASSEWKEHAMQDVTVSGTVTDTQGEPLPGVTVSVLGTTVGTATDLDGRYSLTVPEGSTLVFSFIGFETQSIAIGERNVIDVALSEDLTSLDEVVVVGYGTQRKSDLTGAVTTLQGGDVAQRQQMQVSQALQGAMAGVMVTRNNSAPGAPATIRIRGITTIGDSNPLIIVDGVPFDDIDNINPNDIESISVLKDAASSAIYGARAASGVILVTTKRGKVGEGSLVYNFSFGFETPTEMPKNVGVTRYLEMANEQRWNDSGNNNNEYPTFPREEVENWVANNRQNPDLYPITDWNDLIFKDRAPRSTHSLSITTGTKNIRTNASSHMMMWKAFMPTVDLKGSLPGSTMTLPSLTTCCRQTWIFILIMRGKKSPA